ncbi:LLM class F420-dependent oxidoreductase [Frankia sp. AiPa1]|uniref:LLM class F420-dependent oxidoreductase n=1 Tax=Frankia sp. AiPa1 TaxID=573492 RepID=UPI00202B860C|nr:LLM class F420-dependent oxidoreductase [Frankia sp. AiPa1]MCL9759958.1 LLM class F420-dependent oxidoreductase [Frankia sp. AiPa1]
MRFIYHYPDKHGRDGDMLDAGTLREVAQAAEQAGFDGFSLTEHPIPGARWLDNGGHQSLDPFVALSYVAAATVRLRLLTYLSVAPYRNPFLLAKAAATVDKLSDGRFILGLGAGYQKSEYFALGVDIAERGELFDEVLEVLPLHWSGEPFSYTGRHFNARDVIALPRPVQDPIPVWIGGNSRRARRRVAHQAQGWMPMAGSPQLSQSAQTANISSEAHLAELIAEVRTEAASAGREPVDVTYSYVDPGIAGPQSDPAAAADRHREAFANLEKAGVTWLVISRPTRTPADTLRFIETVGATYLSSR